MSETARTISVADVLLLLLGIAALAASMSGQITPFQTFISAVCVVGFLAVRASVEVVRTDIRRLYRDLADVPGGPLDRLDGP